MKHIGLFEGEGGFSLAADWMGWETLAWCEINPFCQTILKYYWPNANRHTDIINTDFTQYRGKCDILTGGFPCQPFSVAGKQAGTDDPRHLWPQMLRAIREIRPRWVVGENVRGLISWNGGLVFDQVQSDLEAEGYEVFPVLLPACGVNAPHQRYRIWFVAYSKCVGRERWENTAFGRNETSLSFGFSKTQPVTQPERITPHTDNQRNATGLGEVQSENGEISERYDNAEFSDTDSQYVTYTAGDRPQRPTGSELFWNSAGLTRNDSETLSDTSHKGLEGSKVNGSVGSGRADSFEQFTGRIRPNWQNFPTQPPICGGDDGLPAKLDGITFPKWRNESIKAHGNAVVPQVAYEIYKAIEFYEMLY